MHDYLYIDIETLPDMSSGAIDDAKEKVKVPSNYKDPEKIEKYIEEKASEIASKTSFDGLCGHICTIAWAINDEDIKSVHVSDIEEEKSRINEFFSSLPRYKSLTWVGHNILDFDIPFIMKRAFSMGIKLPDQSSFPRNPKPWDKKVFDTMRPFGHVSMDQLHKVVGGEGKNGMSGKDVYPRWCEGMHDMIEKYCRDDVRKVREIHKRFLQIGY